MKIVIKPVILALSLVSTAHAFELSSTDIKEGHPMASTFEYKGWGCNGKNLSPQLAWKKAPEGTKSFAVTAYDPDAPTGSGFWHWVTYDIPATISELPQGANMVSLGAKELNIDYGIRGFGGACPPQGHGMHRYQFTIWALPTEKLELDLNTPAAVAGYTLRATALASATLTATYVR